MKESVLYVLKDIQFHDKINILYKQYEFHNKSIKVMFLCFRHF